MVQTKDPGPDDIGPRLTALAAARSALVWVACRGMTERAFPVIFAERVHATSRFYESLGFTRHFQLPPQGVEDGEPGYVGLRRGGHELAVVAAGWPLEHYRLGTGPGARFEMFVYVDDVDTTFERLRAAGAGVLREPTDMPWGERVGYVTDPEGNPVALAAPATNPPPTATT